MLYISELSKPHLNGGFLRFQFDPTRNNTPGKRKEHHLSQETSQFSNFTSSTAAFVIHKCLKSKPPSYLTYFCLWMQQFFRPGRHLLFIYIYVFIFFPSDNCLCVEQGLTVVSHPPAPPEMSQLSPPPPTPSGSSSCLLHL